MIIFRLTRDQRLAHIKEAIDSGRADSARMHATLMLSSEQLLDIQEALARAEHERWEEKQR